MIPQSTFIPFNPYQQQPASSQNQTKAENNDSKFFDPKSSNLDGFNSLPKSQTFPANKIDEDSNENPYNTNNDGKANNNNTRNSNIKQREEDEDDYDFPSLNKTKNSSDSSSKAIDIKNEPQNNQVNS